MVFCPIINIFTARLNYASLRYGPPRPLEIQGCADCSTT